MNQIHPIFTSAVSLMILIGVGGCTMVPPLHRGSDADFAAVRPESPISAEINHGSIYHAATAPNLFADYKARRIGDILTVLLAEETNARKSANASNSRDTSLQLADPMIAGRPVTNNGVPILNTEVTSEQSFEGQGDAAQSNLLEGSITVTVSEVLANGNLVIRGEKWIRINHGEEYIRLRGIVRPVDIGADNTVLSTQVADAELAYGGIGQMARSSLPGWLTRFFITRIWPF